MPNGDVRWIEIYFCATPLAEERPDWEAYFELTNIRDALTSAAHLRRPHADVANCPNPTAAVVKCSRRLDRVAVSGNDQ